MSADPIEWVFRVIGSGILGLIGVAFMVTVARNLHRLRKEAEKQTALLERMAPPAPKAPDRRPVSYEGWRKSQG